MKRIKWLLGVLMWTLVPMLQSCDDDGYSIGDFSWDWATVRTTGGGGYYLDGDRWGVIDPVSTSIPWYRPVDGERVIAFFNPLYDVKDGVQVKMEGIRDVLTKEVEEMKTEAESEEYGNDPIVIYELRYNTYDDTTDRWGWGWVSYNLEKFYPTAKEDEESKTAMKGFKVTINSEKNGEGRVIVLDFDHPVGVPEKAKDVHSTSLIR